MFKHLVVALDGSPCASRAFELALALAKREGGDVAICSVAEPLAIFPAPNLMAEQALAQVRKHAQEVVDSAGAAARAAGVTATVEVLVGDPAYEIRACARKHGADAIVVGTHGRSGLRRFLVGSVAEGLLRTSSLPVLTVREGARIGLS